MKMRCLLVDDEPLAINLLRKHFQQLDSFEVVATCHNAVKASEILRSEHIDLLLLDIKMPQISGIDFLKTLQHPPKTILTTAYREFALEGYDLGVIDYLLKPISMDRFLKAIDRFWQLHHAPVPAIKTDTPTSYLVVKSGNKYQRINTADIYYIESLRDYIKIYTAGKEIIAKYKISDFEAAVSNKGFLRVHRSFIVNIKKVTAFSPIDIEMDKYEIPVGASYRELIRKTLQMDQ